MTHYTCPAYIANDWGRRRNAACWLFVAWGWLIPIVIIIVYIMKRSIK